MNIDFTFSDTIAGYVTSFDAGSRSFEMKTSDGRDCKVTLGVNLFAELVRNLGEPFHDATGSIENMLEPGRYIQVYGVWFPDIGVLDAKHIVYLGREEQEYRFEQPQWWVKQVQELGDFYKEAEFGQDDPDFREYTTMLDLSGRHMPSTRQETDTISRFTYGFASAYLLTGDDKYLDVAENGTDYLMDNLVSVDHNRDICYWYHALDFTHGRERKILGSLFGDDYNAIPCYEQIYALAGPIQTYRITGDPEILEIARMTINLFKEYYRDKSDKGGYFSHLDPVTLDPKADSLGQNKGRKNWNSVGDHAPAYLINLYLATGKQEYADMLEDCFDTICAHFPDYDNSPFVQEKFFEDWSHDEHWGWQQNRAVVGHNLKIAWNLMRMHSLKAKSEYEDLAKKIAAVVPKVGMDAQRGGWYDVMERKVREGEKLHRFAWHDRKAWWQQEQAILAYYILNGVLKDDEYRKLARESAAFYNSFFLDHDSGGIYFNTLANGLPYLMGTERDKGSHSMAGYHSFELCYLAQIYINLLCNKQPMDFFFRPKPNGFDNRVLRVEPDILPKGSIKISAVEIDGSAYDKFDADALTVNLPDASDDIRVKVTLTPQ